MHTARTVCMVIIANQEGHHADADASVHHHEPAGAFIAWHTLDPWQLFYTRACCLEKKARVGIGDRARARVCVCV